ncbi:hypothetical protein LXL04_011270 [Taraxacum kok-saghyz]
MYRLKRSYDEYLVCLGESYKRCPSRDYRNCDKKDHVIVEYHLIRCGFMRGRHWLIATKSLRIMMVQTMLHMITYMECCKIVRMMLLKRIMKNVQNLFDDSDKHIKYTKLYAMLKLFNLKANNRWSDARDEMPLSTYKAKKLLCPFMRYMGVLKGYVRNRYRPEGSIINGYATGDVIKYCTDLQGVTNIGVPRSRHEGRLIGHVKKHITIIAPYINENKRMLEMANRGRSKSEGNLWLGDNGSYCTRSRERGYTFYINQQDEKSAVQNNRVTVIVSIVDLSTNDYVSKLFILAKHATQMFYVEDQRTQESTS